MATINEIEEALQLFFNKSYDKDFIKSKLSSLQSDGEQPLLGYLAFYLLGWFGEKTLREQPVDHRLTDSGKGRVDFVIGKTALEVAVRTKDQRSSQLLCQNEGEIAKLLKYGDGKAVLALFDYHAQPIEKKEIENYFRSNNPMHGNTKVSAYNVLYFHTDGNQRLEIHTR